MMRLGLSTRPASEIVLVGLMVSKVYNGTYDPKGQENKIYTIVSARRHTVLLTSVSLLITNGL